MKAEANIPQLDWFIFIWSSLILYWCSENYKYIFHSVSCTHTDSLAFREFVYIHVLCIRFAKRTLFDLGGLLSPRLSVFCTFGYRNHFCLISTQTNFCFLFCFIFIALYRLLKNTLWEIIAYKLLDRLRAFLFLIVLNQSNWIVPRLKRNHS